MSPVLPASSSDAMSLGWSDFQPHYQALADDVLTADNLSAWLSRWSDLHALLDEVEQKLYVATTLNTADKPAQDRLMEFMKNVHEPRQVEEEKLRQKLITSGLSTPNMDVAVRQMRANSSLFREENLPLETQLVELGNEYDGLCGARTITWDGEEITLEKASQVLEEGDRARREKAWRLKHERILEDRAPFNALWTKMFDLRREIANNAGKTSYMDYIWQAYHRFDYTPEDCQTFRDAILSEVVPAARQVYEDRRRSLEVEDLKPWDLDIDLFGSQPLTPFQQEEDLNGKSQAIFDEMDPALGDYYRDMVENDRMDLFSRKNKANGGYCMTYSHIRKPFIFMNAVGTHDNLQTLLHEAGHAFHAYESAKLDFVFEANVGSEFAEVASMGMEMLSHPYFSKFYSESDAARARIQHLEKQLLFWPYMAVVDGFQTWAYLNPEQGRNPEACDAEWGRLWDAFMPGIDYSGLDDIKVTGWHRKLHIFHIPFYYVEYGLAQVGALQVWLNSKRDRAAALASYRKGLSLGSTVGLPQLFEAAGGKFSFDAATLKQLVGAITNEFAEQRAKI
jgi:oligoendopeptidase F